MYVFSRDWRLQSLYHFDLSRPWENLLMAFTATDFHADWDRIEERHELVVSDLRTDFVAPANGLPL